MRPGASVAPAGLTVDPELHGAPVLAGDEGVLPAIAPVGLRDGEAMQLPDGHVVEPLLQRELDLHAVPQPAALHVVFVHLELEGRSVFLQNLQEPRFASHKSILFLITDETRTHQEGTSFSN